MNRAMNTLVVVIAGLTLASCGAQEETNAPANDTSLAPTDAATAAPPSSVNNDDDRPSASADVEEGLSAVDALPAAEKPGTAQKPTGERNPAGAQPVKSTAACQLQGAVALRVTPRRAVGTEPFWAARVDGRCVNYSNPEDPIGTRVWTRYATGQDGEAWSGALGGRLFELKIRHEPGCSDGMSDKRYPMAVELKVHGEIRKGCAEPA